MYTHLLSYLYELKIDGENIKDTDIRRKTIEEITCTLRRNDSSSLTIVFDDPTLYWHNVFSRNKPVHVYFRGMNLDNSAEEEFEGYSSSVTPLTEIGKYRLEVMFLDVPLALNTRQKKSRSFKNMSRLAVVQMLAKENKASLHVVNEGYIGQVEEEIVLSINDTMIQFMSNILDDVGYRISVTRLNRWTVTPKIPKTRAKLIHSNQGKDGSLLSFTPTFNPYMYTEVASTGTGLGGSGRGDQAVDPDTGKVEESGEDKGAIETFKDQIKVFYDDTMKRWIETK